MFQPTNRKLLAMNLFKKELSRAISPPENAIFLYSPTTGFFLPRRFGHSASSKEGSGIQAGQTFAKPLQSP